MRGKTIVIDREYGSGGREVAKLLSEKLGIPFYDGELLVLASEKYGIDLGMMKDYDEKRMGSILYSIAMATSYASDFDKITKPYEIYEAQAKVMRQLVSEGPCIFLGRCAAEILKDKTELLNVFIYSSDQHAKTEEWMVLHRAMRSRNYIKEMFSGAIIIIIFQKKPGVTVIIMTFA